MKRNKLRHFLAAMMQLSIIIVTVACSNSESEELERQTFILTVSSQHGGIARAEKNDYLEGETVAAMAIADEGYDFSGWYEEDVLLSESTEYSFPMPSHNVTLTAAFTINKSEEKVSTDEAIDLGLSVKWAPRNIGATASDEYGGLYGWGDATGLNQSLLFDEYPSATPPANISGTEYDIALAKWGKDWRLPTVEETLELVEKCTWEWAQIENINGMHITGPNGNSIFLPACASRNGETVSTQQGQRGCYWTCSLYSNSNFAYYLYFYERGLYGDRNNRRYMGMAVRPVINDKQVNK